MSVKFSELIDKENVLLDKKRLAEWKQNAGRFELFTKINEIRDSFIEDIDDDDIEVITSIYRFAEKIKKKL